MAIRPSRAGKHKHLVDHQMWLQILICGHLKNQIKHLPTMNTNAGVPGCLRKLALGVKIIALDGMQLRGRAEETDGIWVHMQTGALSFIVFVRTQPRKKDGLNTKCYISHDHPNYTSPSTKFA